MMDPMDFFDGVIEELNDGAVEAFNIGAVVIPIAWTLALTSKGKIQFIADGRKYQLKSQSPKICEVGEDCVLKLYCSTKGCDVSAYVNRHVTAGTPDGLDFDNFRFEPPERVHLTICLSDAYLESEIQFRSYINREAEMSPALSLADVYAAGIALIPAAHSQFMPTETSLQSSFYAHRAIFNFNPGTFQSA